MSKLEVGRFVSGSDPRDNQARLRTIRESQERIFGDPKSKEGKAGERRARDEEFARDWINRQSELNLSPRQRFELALKRGNNDDVKFLFSHMDDMTRFGYETDTYIFPAKEEIEKRVRIIENVDEKITQSHIGQSSISIETERNMRRSSSGDFGRKFMRAGRIARKIKLKKEAGAFKEDKEQAT